MALRKKLYYQLAIEEVQAESGNITVGTGPQQGSQVAIRFTGSTGANFGADADFDRYGNVMEPNNFAGAAGNVARCRQAIGAWFQFGSANAAGLTMDVMVDFITGTAPAINTAAAIDPATDRRPRCRVTLNQGVTGAGTGILYIQRQHAMEV